MVLSGEGGVGACGIDRIDPVQMDIDTKRKKKKKTARETRSENVGNVSFYRWRSTERKVSNKTDNINRAVIGQP